MKEGAMLAVAHGPGKTRVLTQSVFYPKEKKEIVNLSATQSSIVPPV